MPSRKKDFGEQDVIRALLWCARHCCLCERQCGVAIEIAHIDATGPRSLDNAIPLCFDRHQKIGSYNDKHAKGRKFRPNELKTRRDQIYEKYTSHLVPPLLYKLVQAGRALPDVGFQIVHGGGPYPIRAKVSVSLGKASRPYEPPSGGGHYDGTYLWNLNPGFGVNGHFSVQPYLLEDKSQPIRARIDVTVIDIYGREHRLLPIGYVHRLGEADEWYLEPYENALD